MKKILVLAVLAIMAVGSANAQIQIGSKNGRNIPQIWVWGLLYFG